MQEGRCEVDPDRECAWVRIYERLKGTGRLDRMKEALAPRSYSRVTTPGRVVHPGYKRRYPADA
jgi:hypothetical protein